MKKILFPLFLAFILSACSDKELTPNEVAEQFWQAAQHGKLESAKQLVTWDTADYLKYFNNEKLTIKRVDFNESEIQDNKVVIDTVLIIQKTEGSDIRIPTKTVLIKTENVWRVQLKSTLVAVLNQTMNTAANQFNRMLREGMQELNKALSGSVNEISKSLEEGAKELNEALQDNAEGLNESLEKLQRNFEEQIPKDQTKKFRKEI